MRVRHRVPSIFNLSMVDVLCCALGCVILLWLLNLRNARDHEMKAAEKLAEAHSESARARADTELARQEGEKAFGQLLLMGQYLAQAEDNISVLRRQLTRTEAQLAELDALYKDATGRGLKLAEDLRRANIRHNEIAASLKLDLEKSMDERRKEEAMSRDLRAQIARQVEELAGDKEKVTRLLAELEGSRKAMAREKALSDKLAKELAQLQGETTRLGDALTESKKTIGTMEASTRAAQSEAKRLREAAESRFEGIALTGKRVVFLVDMSGSMTYVDEKTEAPHKWVSVRQTVARLMQSLPELAQYQVIVFARSASFPLGGEGRWLDFDPQSSPKQVLDALAKIKPDGDTNMSDAMELAFRFRPEGLDTVYLLSDGLPNYGTGLPVSPGRELTEAEKTDFLSKHIRNKLKNDWNKERPGQKQVRINAVGFFYESPEVGAFLWALARENDGSFVGMSKP
jgi:hypothetical protein